MGMRSVRQLQDPQSQGESGPRTKAALAKQEFGLRGPEAHPEELQKCLGARIQVVGRTVAGLNEERGRKGGSTRHDMSGVQGTVNETREDKVSGIET